MNEPTKVGIEYTLWVSDWVAFYRYLEDEEFLENHWFILIGVPLGALLWIAIWLAFLVVVAVAVFFSCEFLFAVLFGPNSLLPLMLTGAVLISLVVSITFGSLAYFCGGAEPMIKKVDKSIKSGTIRLNRKYQMSINPIGLIGKEELPEDREGIGFSEQREEGVSWAAISAIDSTEYHAFFVVNEKQYVIVPAGAFPTRKAFFAFVEKAKRLRAGVFRGEIEALEKILA